jgi:hypothetical protein
LAVDGMLVAMTDGRDHLRAADADRQTVAERLRLALDEGRLDFHEYDLRLRDAYAAKTYGELDRLIGDLPDPAPVERSGLAVPPTTVPPTTASPTPADPGRDVNRRWLVALWDDYVGAVAICVAIWLAVALSGDGWQGFWPIWVAGPWGAYLAYETAKGLATGEPQRWAARQQRKKGRKKGGKREGRAAGRTPEIPG